MASNPPDKRTLRRRMRALRASVAVGDQEAWSEAIAARLAAHPSFAAASTIHTFVGALPGEIDTRATIARCLAAGRRVICPRVHGDVLQHIAITSLDDLVEGPLGLWEPDPTRGETLEAPDPDVVLVPGLAFDAAGGRLGLGRGYYDRFLAGLETTTIGLAYEAQVIPCVPTEPHDVRIDWVVTETRTIDCAGGAP